MYQSPTAPTFSFESHEKAYEWISEVLDRFGYNKEDSSKKEKTSIRRYIKKYTEYSRSQITRLIKEKKETSTLKYGKGKKRNRFKKSTPRKMPNFSPKRTMPIGECPETP